jgi:plastocyanin
MLRKVLFTAVAVLSLAVAAGASAKTVTVTITNNGYVPNSVSVTEGDAVQFTNSDSVVHQVTFKSTAGVSCTPTPLVVQPNASGSCTFRTAGSYSYSDPNAKGNTFRGSVVVAAAAQSLTMATKSLLVYGATGSNLSGVLSTQAIGANIDVLAQQCGASASSKLTTVQTTAGGAYATAVKPLMNTAYTARTKSLSSVTIIVRVRPSMHLRKVAAHRYTLRITAGSSFAGKYASFQRYNATLDRWVAVRTLLLKSSTAGIAPSVASTVAFRSSIPANLRIRATFPQPQAGSCYASGTSNTTLS